jgi:hypothetical protein
MPTEFILRNPRDAFKRLVKHCRPGFFNEGIDLRLRMMNNTQASYLLKSCLKTPHMIPTSALDFERWLDVYTGYNVPRRYLETPEPPTPFTRSQARQPVPGPSGASGAAPSLPPARPGQPQIRRATRPSSPKRLEKEKYKQKKK